MPRRDRAGDTWRCDNPACLGWTWVATSTTRCFRCKAPAPPNMQLRLLPPGHRELRGWVLPDEAAAGRGVSARPRQPEPAAAQAEVRAGPAGLHHLPPPPPPPLPPRHAVHPVAVLVLGPPMLPTPRVISVWSTVRLRQETAGMLYVRLLRCRLAPLPGSAGPGGPALNPRRSQQSRDGSATPRAALAEAHAPLEIARLSDVPARVMLPPGTTSLPPELPVSFPRCPGPP